MDEEDGRPGSSARKFGPPDVLTDVFAVSLRSRSIPIDARISIPKDSAAVIRESLSSINRQPFPRLFSVAGLLKASASPQVEEKHHENVPGK